MTLYTLGLFANNYPADPSDWRGIFIKRMVDDLESHGVIVKKAVKRTPSSLGYIPFYLNSIRLALNEEPDIFQAEYIPHSSIIPAILKGRRPLVLKFHGDDARIFPFKSRYHRSLTSYMLKKADHIITSSEEIKIILTDLGAENQKITAIHSGVDTEYFRPFDKGTCRKRCGLDPESIIFIFVGRLHQWKGVNEILAVAKTHRNYCFIFVGPGEVPEHSDNCKFIGPVPPSQVRIWMNAADCIMLPTYTEAIPTVILESSSCGIPAITTDVGGCPEIVKDGETGILISLKDISSLERAVEWMAEHPFKRGIMGKKAREKVVREFDRRVMVERLIGVHKMLL